MALTDDTKVKLRSVVVELVNDCLHWYADDMEEIQKMDREKLKCMIVDYMVMRSYFQMTDKPMPSKGQLCNK